MRYHMRNIEVNGKTINKMDLNLSLRGGHIIVEFKDGTKLEANIQREQNIKQLHPLQHIYKTNKGIVTVEYWLR